MPSRNSRTFPAKKKTASPAASREIHWSSRAFCWEKDRSLPMLEAIFQPRTSTAKQGIPEIHRKMSQGKKRLENSG